MKVAIVILNWNGKQLLETFLPLVVAHSRDEASIFVADNASTDGSISYVSSHFPNVGIIKMNENRGYAGGYNEALQHVDADIFVLMNSDIATTEGWLQPIVRHFKTQPKTGILQPKLLDYKRKTHFEYAGAAGGFIDRLGYPFCRGRIFNQLEADLGQYDDEAHIFWASGACLCIRRDVFWQLGGLDEDFFAHQEEIDLCWRAHKAGFEVKYIGDSHVYHVGGATLGSMSPQKTFYNFRNTLLALLKNAPKRFVPFLVLTRLVLDGVAGLKFMVEGKFIHTWAIFRAHGSFYKLAAKMLKKRQETPTYKPYYKTQSIVFLHFVLGIRKFKDL
ncbi:MAG: glycosyltransferase family 2 protein [Bacteroidetes bacterium]|nr:glycosyltransferase family 2 protein [Bacteroidota bacterium]